MVALRTICLALLTALAAPALLANEAPSCVADTAGIVACFDDRLCRCAFQRGGSMVDRAAGYRWDCGPLRPNCHRPPSTVQRQARPFADVDLLLPLADVRRWPRPDAPVDPAPPTIDPAR